MLSEALFIYSGGLGNGAGARFKAASIAQAPARKVVYIKNAPMFVRVAEGERMIAETVCGVLGLAVKIRKELYDASFRRVDGRLDVALGADRRPAGRLAGCPDSQTHQEIVRRSDGGASLYGNERFTQIF